jgi:hypothetical protein
MRKQPWETNKVNKSGENNQVIRSGENNQVKKSGENNQVSKSGENIQVINYSLKRIAQNMFLVAVLLLINRFF